MGIRRNSMSGMETEKEERIQVSRIRIQSVNHLAILSEFREADRLLSSWVDRSAANRLDLHFEIVFQDGFVFHCRHVFRCGTGRHSTLSNLVRKAFHGRLEGFGKLPGSPERYEINSV